MTRKVLGNTLYQRYAGSDRSRSTVLFAAIAILSALFLAAASSDLPSPENSRQERAGLPDTSRGRTSLSADTTYRHLGPFSGLVDAVRSSHPLWPLAKPGQRTRDVVEHVFGFEPGNGEPLDVRCERKWARDGIQGEEISWSVGYGPRTVAWMLRPSAVRGKVPGIIALHDHGGFKFFGKEKIADGPDGPQDAVREMRNELYGGQAFANALALRGFAVLVPDVFLWGSRKFPREVVPEFLRRRSEQMRKGAGSRAIPDSVAEYNILSSLHEEVVAKYCQVLGTSIAAVVSFEDRIAAAYLASRPDVDSAAIGCIGLSGGGLRAVLLQATCERIKAAVVVSMMSTYEGMLDHNIVSHTWMLYPSDWSRFGDYPDLAACRAPSPLLVQYNRNDRLFTIEGMRGADDRLRGHYVSADHPDCYTGQFFDGPHKFDRAMQDSAFAWLQRELVR